MVIKDVIFYKSVFIDDSKIFIENKNELVFIGRSNVWKSSIMNAIFRKKNLVKTSSLPWKTKTANIFLVDNKYYYTDLPWYWFSLLWKELKEKMDWLISWYLEERATNIKKAVLLIDSKIWVQESDLDMYKFLLDLWIDLVIILSKIDKLSINEVWKLKENISKQFFWTDIFLVSSKNNIWINELSKYLKNTLKNS